MPPIKNKTALFQLTYLALTSLTIYSRYPSSISTH